MKTKFLLLAIFFSVQLVAQGPAVEWVNSIPNQNINWFFSVTRIQQTTDGGYVTVCTKDSGALSPGLDDYCIVKWDSLGNVTWQKTYGGSGKDTATSIDQTADGGYIVAGYTESNNGDVTGNHGTADFWILKLDSFGNLLWQRTYGGSYYEYANSIQQTLDGGYIVVGSTDSVDGDVPSSRTGYTDCWIIKLDESGNLLWQKVLSLGVPQYREWGNIVQQTADGGYIIGGAVDYGPIYSNFRFLVFKLDEVGNLIWTSIPPGNYYWINMIKQTIDGGFILTGQSQATYSNPPVGSYQGCKAKIIKLDATGQVVWSSSFAFPDNATSIPLSLCQTVDGGYVVVGALSTQLGDADMIKVDGSGDLQWILPASTTDVLLSDIQLTNDGGFVGCGSSSSVFKIVKFGPETLSASEFQSENESMIYPNPSQEVINVKVKDQYQSLSINDISGKQLFQTNEKIESLSMANYQKGIYFLTIQFENGKTETHKIIKN